MNSELSHDDACRLSRAFNQVAYLDGGQDTRINEWLKGITFTNPQGLL